MQPKTILLQHIYIPFDCFLHSWFFSGLVSLKPSQPPDLRQQASLHSLLPSVLELEGQLLSSSEELPLSRLSVTLFLSLPEADQVSLEHDSWPHEGRLRKSPWLFTSTITS